MDFKAAIRAPKKRRFDLNVAVLGHGPQFVNPKKFAEAREQQLQAFIDCTTFQGGARRTFQLMPRHLRRRAMSHNIRRMPRRLRETAQKEMDKCNTKATGGVEKLRKTRRHKRRPNYLLRDYVRRQREYQWLETHIWHAKRMKMVPLWGYKLAEYPRAKGVRSTFRASEFQCTIHDASYHVVVELVGNHDAITSILSSMTPPDSPSIANMMYSDGARAGNVHLYHVGQHPLGLIAPVSFVWKPRVASDDERQLWMWVHAAAFEEALSALRLAVTSGNALVKVNSLKDQLLRFELTGAKAHSALYSVLQLADPKQKEEASSQASPEKLWRSLSDLRTPASLPCGIVIPLTVNDPRINFPPKKYKIAARVEEAQKGNDSFLSSLDFHAGTSDLPHLWSSDKRVEVGKVESHASIIKKLAKQVTEPSGKRETAEVPVLLVQRAEGLTRGYGAGWDLVLPAGWGLPFWVSLIFAGARPIGQRDKHKIHTEQGLPFFPHDYPDTRAYMKHSVLEAQQRAVVYARKPPAKRTNYKRMGIFSPFRPPWESLFGIENKIVIKLPRELFNYGNKPPKEKHNNNINQSSEDKEKTDDTNNKNKTDKPKNQSQRPSTSNKNNKRNNTDTSDIKTTATKISVKTTTATTTTTTTSTTPPTTTEGEKGGQEEKVLFAVLRGTRAAALVETRRDTPRQEKHKQKNLGMVWIPKTRQPMDEAAPTSSPFLVRVHIRMARKGTPLFNALPTEEDCSRWLREGLSTSTSFLPPPKRTSHPSPPLPPAVQQTPTTNLPAPQQTQNINTTNIKTKKQIKEAKKQQKEVDLNDLSNGKGFWDIHQPEATHRKIIGYVTSGAYSQVRTSGSGIGFCCSQYIPSLFNSKRPGELVLIRNIDSLYYQIAFVSIRE